MSSTAPEKPAEPRVEQPKVIQELVAAVALALSAAGVSISLATLIFSGPLSDGLPRASSAFVLGAAVVTLVVGQRTRVFPVASIVQDGPAVVMVAVAATVASRSGAGAVEILILCGLASLLAGLGMLLVARLGLGTLVRYLPVTVVSGFIAGTGWLLFKGGIDVMVGDTVGLGDVGGLFTADMARFWVPGVALGIGIVAIGKSAGLPPLAGSALVVIATAAFYAIGLASSSLTDLENGGWLIGPFSSGASLQPITPGEVADADWGAILSQPLGLVSVVMVALVAVLLNVTGLEHITGSRVTMERELTSVGAANVGLSLMGSMVGYHALGDTVLARRLGATSRLASVFTAAILAALAILGTQLIGFVPRFVVGGFLVTVGLGLLLDWFSELVTADTTFRLLSLTIVVTMAAIGILEGIGLGLVIACVLFVVRYSRVDPIRRTSNGYRARSRVERTSAEMDALREVAESLLVLELHGFLFFGSLARLDDRLRAEMESPDPPVAIVLDLSRVTGLDRSGHMVLSRSAREAEAVGATLYVCGASASIVDSLTRSGEEHAGTGLIVQEGSLDLLLESIEEQVLNGHHRVTAEASLPDRMSAELLDAFDSVNIAPGQVLIEQDTDGDELFVVMSGRLSVEHLDNGERTRLRTVGPGTALGETALLGGHRRSAEVVAIETSRVLRLHLDTYEQLRRNQPLVALELIEHLLAQQAVALRRSTDLVHWVEG